MTPGRRETCTPRRNIFATAENADRSRRNGGLSGLWRPVLRGGTAPWGRLPPLPGPPGLHALRPRGEPAPRRVSLPGRGARRARDRTGRLPPLLRPAGFRPRGRVRARRAAPPAYTPET